MKKNYSFPIGRILLFTIFLASCSDAIMEENSLNDNSNTEGLLATRSAFDNYFDWENNHSILMKSETGIVVEKRLPWQAGINNAGIPIDWYDPHIESTDQSLKKYTRDQGWELVYSNVMEATSFKYIGLYNKYTGIMRFFMCIFAEPGGAGTSGSMWGVSVNNATSLLNFTYNYGKGIDEKSPSPAFVSTPVGAFSNQSYSGVGLQNGTWYGIEFICAYDPSIAQTNSHYFTLMGRAVNKTITVGQIETTGTIDGTIKGTIPTSSTNLNFSNMFNNPITNKSLSISNALGVVNVGEKIDKGIEENNSFFKGLWDNIKGNASKWISTGLQSGAQKGLEAIVSKGGSVIGDAIGGLFNSLVGKKNNQVDLKVDLNLKATATVNLESTNISQGWSDVSLPVPGSSTVSSNQPIYNNLLGVWNLMKTPEVIIKPYVHHLLSHPPSNQWSRTYDQKCYVNYSIDISTINIDINPAIKDEFNVQNFRCTLLIPEIEGLNSPFHYRDKGIPYSILDEKNYYTTSKLRSHNTKWLDHSFSSELSCTKINFKVQVAFNLVKKTDASEIYTYSKVFEAKNKIMNTSNTYVWSNRQSGTMINSIVYDDLPENWWHYLRDGEVRYSGDEIVYY